MSVIDNVDLDYIHNEIAMDNSHDAINIIVEGMTDAKLMEDFTIEDKCSIYHVDSRDNVIDLMRRLEAEGKTAYTVAIVDADQNKIMGETLPAHMLYTDTNDIETMIFWSDAFYKIARQLFEASKTPDRASISAIRKNVRIQALFVGELRLVSKRMGWYLSFKDSNTKKDLDFKKFIDYRTMKYGGDKVLVEAVKNHSKLHKLATKDVMTEILILRKEKHPSVELVVGHDVTKVITLALKHVLGKEETKNFNREQVEIVFRAAYGNDDFKKTYLRTAMEDAVRDCGISFLKN